MRRRRSSPGFQVRFRGLGFGLILVFFWFGVDKEFRVFVGTVRRTGMVRWGVLGKPV
ncbi:hypothetical protein Hanom_Chr07g00665091 [Helianthus anomalus]